MASADRYILDAHGEVVTGGAAAPGPLIDLLAVCNRFAPGAAARGTPQIITYANVGESCTVDNATLEANICRGSSGGGAEAAAAAAFRIANFGAPYTQQFHNLYLWPLNTSWNGSVPWPDRPSSGVYLCKPILGAGGIQNSTKTPWIEMAQGGVYVSAGLRGNANPIGLVAGRQQAAFPAGRVGVIDYSCTLYEILMWIIQLRSHALAPPGMRQAPCNFELHVIACLNYFPGIQPPAAVPRIGGRRRKNRKITKRKRRKRRKRRKTKKRGRK